MKPNVMAGGLSDDLRRCWEPHFPLTPEARDSVLELQGVYRNDKAKGLACWRDSLAECNPDKCMGWRRVDAEHGYCAVVGRS
jgi:hypothetical protein